MINITVFQLVERFSRHKRLSESAQIPETSVAPDTSKCIASKAGFLKKQGCAYDFV